METCAISKWNMVNGQISLFLKLKKKVSDPIEALFQVSFELVLLNIYIERSISKKGEHLGICNDEMGFRNFIDLKKFKNSCKGYLINDVCMFGVKILHIVPIKTPIECLNPVEKVTSDCKKKKKLRAREYHRWLISIYPKGIKENAERVSLCLRYHDSIHNTPSMKVETEWTTSKIDQIEGKHRKTTCSHSTEGVVRISTELFLFHKNTGSTLSEKVSAWMKRRSFWAFGDKQSFGTRGLFG